MHRAWTARCLQKALRLGEAPASAGLPLYLCPAVGWSKSPSFCATGSRGAPRRRNHADSAAEAAPIIVPDASKTAVPTTAPIVAPITTTTPVERRLPLTCSGCGSFSQTVDPHQFGYFDLKNKRIKAWLQLEKDAPKARDLDGDETVSNALNALGHDRLVELGLNPATLLLGQGSYEDIVTETLKPPKCDRCHNLIHYSTSSETAKIPMYHPTVETLRETIEESPHKYHHIYHLIDAADFPMSLIPRLNVLLGDIPLRTKNRRSRALKYQKDRRTEMSFIITRADLLAPQKDQVDAMMPYLREVLRDALGRVGQRVRLGNLRCVSAKQSWWTKHVKEDIWDRGGAGWLVGKVNVGKSLFFEAVYPKGRMKALPGAPDSSSSQAGKGGSQAAVEDYEGVEIGELLPPPQPAQNYPEMPVVSSLPGTTASPIRVPYGDGKGELIDLPGLARSDLDNFVKEEHRKSLLLKKRIVPTQISLSRGRSLVLGGGLIRITPRQKDQVFLMYNFTNLHAHETMDEKAIGFQNQTRVSVGLENITMPGMGDKMKLAGNFELRYDVTKARAGPLVRKNAINLPVEKLPFRVLSIDILIEGVGYVEIVTQVRAKDMMKMEDGQGRQNDVGDDQDWPAPPPKEPEDPFSKMRELRRDNNATGPTKMEPKKAPEVKGPLMEWPSVDIYTPEGRFIGSRRPMDGYSKNKRRVQSKHQKTRPRRSMKGAKKLEKQRARTAERGAQG